ncbi:hypothetical protein PUN28_006279 [Cardiocondyla obscurior]
MFFNINGNILNIPRHRILKNCLIFQKYDVKVDILEKLYYCLRLIDYKLEHRINLFKDMGVPAINTTLISRSISHLNSNVSKFKDKVDIPPYQSIAVNIFGNEASKEISKLELSDKMTLKQYYQRCLLYCKTHVFNLPYLDDKILLDRYTKIKSISMITETLKVLRTDVGYDEKIIKKNPWVITASSDNIRSLLSNFTDILGIPIVKCLKKYPYLLFEDVENIKRLLILFEKYEIPDKYVKSYMKVFKISNEAFYERIEMMKRHPDLNIWYKHPRMVQMLCQIKKTRHRIQYVNIMDSSKWANPQAFLSSKTVLDKSMQIGLVSSKRNLKHVIMKELGVDESNLLLRHQHWKTAAFAEVVNMLKYLKMHFTIDEIRPNIHIVLYEQSKVEKMLVDLKRQYSKSKRYSFTNSQYLALCLYMLEKDNHFTGDGIWNKERNAKHKYLKDENTVEKSDYNTSPVEDNDNSLSLENNDSIDHMMMHER